MSSAQKESPDAGDVGADRTIDCFGGHVEIQNNQRRSRAQVSAAVAAMTVVAKKTRGREER